MNDKKLTLDELMSSSVVEKPACSENRSIAKKAGNDNKSIASKVEKGVTHIDNCVQMIHEDTNRIHDLNTEICSAYLREDGTPRDFADCKGREEMTASIRSNTKTLLVAFHSFSKFKEELLKSIPNEVTANLSEKHEKLLGKFYKHRIYYILSLGFSIAFGVSFMVLFFVRNAQLSEKEKEVELQKKDYQEFVNWGRYMKETNPNTWKKWENGEIKYVPVNQ
jgi:hypothetical protein